MGSNLKTCFFVLALAPVFNGTLPLTLAQADEVNDALSRIYQAHKQPGTPASAGDEAFRHALQKSLTPALPPPATTAAPASGPGPAMTEEEDDDGEEPAPQARSTPAFLTTPAAAPEVQTSQTAPGLIQFPGPQGK